nr:lysozyme [uncultured Desulfobulbus sp.]
MKIPRVLLSLIRKFEGLRLRAYYCPAGVLTCGYGSTGPDITKSTVWTKETAEARMRDDAEKFVVATRRLCPGLLACPGADDQNIGAIADFAYNLGATRLAGSTLRRKINAGDFEGARIELKKWVRGGGKILPGLVLRRTAEATLLRSEA